MTDNGDTQYSVSVKTFSKTVHVILRDVLGSGHKWILPKTDSITWAIVRPWDRNLTRGGQDIDGYFVQFSGKDGFHLSESALIDLQTGEVLWEREA